MGFNAELNVFRSFVLGALGHRGWDDWVARGKFTNSNGGLGERTIKSIDFADNDAPFALFRSAADKADNRAIRQAFMDALENQFPDGIPQSVLEKFTNGVSDKPLTARRIALVLIAAQKELKKQEPVNQINIEPDNVAQDIPEWQTSDPKQAEYEERTDTARHFGIKETEYDISARQLKEILKTYSKCPEAHLKYFDEFDKWAEKYGYKVEKGWFSNTESYAPGKEEEAKGCRPKPPEDCPEKADDLPRYLVLKNVKFGQFGRPEFRSVGEKPSQEDNQIARRGLAKLYDGIMKAAGVSIADRNKKLEALLKAEVINEPVTIEEMDKFVKTVDLLMADKTYNDGISQNELRGELKLNYQQLGNSILKPLLSSLGTKVKLFESLSVGNVSLTKGENGLLKFQIDDFVPRFNMPYLDKLAAEKPGTEEDSKYERTKGFFETGAGTALRPLINSNNGKSMSLSLYLKPEDFDPSTGRLKLKLQDLESTNGLIQFLKTILTGPLNSFVEPLLPHGEGKMLNVALGSAGNSLLDLELDLNRIGSERLNEFGLNGSVAGNLRELKFEENGLSLKLGDNQIGVNNQSENVNPAVGQPPLLAHTQDLTRLTKTVVKLLRTKANDFIDFKGFSLSNADQSGAFEVKFRMLDIDKVISNRTNMSYFKDKVVRLLGLDRMTNVSIKVRPTLDPQTGHVRLTLASFGCDQLNKGLGNLFKNRVLSTLSSVITGKLNNFLLESPKAGQPLTVKDRARYRLSLRPQIEYPGSLATVDFDVNAFIQNDLPHLDNDYARIVSGVIGQGKVSAFHANERGIHLELNDTVQNLV